MDAFLDACAKGNLPQVMTFLSQGYSANETGHRKGTPLTISARKGHHNVVSQLIAKGADVHTKGGRNGGIPLHYASVGGHLKVVKVLLDKGTTIDKKDGQHATALILAAKKGHRDVVSYLIASGANVGKKDRYGRTPLHYASKMGDLETVGKLLEAGAEIDEMSRDHSTPLMLAVHTEQVAIISYLLDHGADISKQDESGQKCTFSTGSETRKSEAGRFSFKANTQFTRDMNSRGDLSRQTLSYAINHKHRTTAKVLITHGVGMEGLLNTSPPMTALMWTAQEGDDSLAKELILQGVNVNYQNPDGCIALHFGQVLVI